MKTVEQILEDARELPRDQRLTLAHRILVADEADPPEEVSLAWDLAIRERIARYDRGESRARPVSEVLADLGNRLGE